MGLLVAYKDRRDLWILLIVILVTVVTLLPSVDNQFTNWDDNKYVVENNLIRNLSPSGVKDIFSSFLLGNYHPITVLSYALEYKIFGLDPFYYHLTNLLLHLLNTVLVFWLVVKLCGPPPTFAEATADKPDPLLNKEGEGLRSANPLKTSVLSISNEGLFIAGFTALLFGIHPLHVEPVAWISGRKELLYSAFFLAALLSYINYIRQPGFYQQPGRRYYIYVCVFFVLACLSKATAVVLPVLLFAFDYFLGRRIDRSALLEKLPLFALSILFGVTAIFAQQSFDAFHAINTYSIFERILFSSYGLLSYLTSLIFPVGLSCFYPYPEKTEGMYPQIIYFSPLIIGYLGFVLVKYFRNNSTVIFGSLFFVICIFPVIQLIPFGESLVADRYTYLPYVGLFFVLGNGFSIVLFNKKQVSFAIKTVMAVALATMLITFPVHSWKRSQVWQDSFTLWNDVIDKYDNVWEAYNNRGLTYMYLNKLPQAVADFNAAINLRPEMTKLYYNRAYAFFKSGNIDQAISDCNYAISVDPDAAQGYANRGSFYLDSDNYGLALKDFNKAISIDPTLELTYLNRGKLFSKTGQWQKAIADFNRVIELNPHNIEAHDNRGFNYINEENYIAAINEYTAIIDIDENYSPAYYNRAVAYYHVSDFAKALKDVQKARGLGFVIDQRFYLELVKKVD